MISKLYLVSQSQKIILGIQFLKLSFPKIKLTNNLLSKLKPKLDLSSNVKNIETLGI